jgi:hypothetical protein
VRNSTITRILLAVTSLEAGRFISTNFNRMQVEPCPPYSRKNGHKRGASLRCPDRFTV